MVVVVLPLRLLWEEGLCQCLALVWVVAGCAPSFRVCDDEVGDSCLAAVARWCGYVSVCRPDVRVRCFFQPVPPVVLFRVLDGFVVFLPGLFEFGMDGVIGPCSVLERFPSRLVCLPVQELQLFRSPVLGLSVYVCDWHL